MIGVLTSCVPAGVFAISNEDINYCTQSHVRMQCFSVSLCSCLPSCVCLYLIVFLLLVFHFHLACSTCLFPVSYVCLFGWCCIIFASLYALVAFGVVRWWFCGAWLLEWRFGVDAWQRACYEITAFIVGVGCSNRFAYTLLFVVAVSSFCPLEI